MYYEAPLTGSGAALIPRPDLGLLPEVNDDPALIPYVELINEGAPGNFQDKKYLGMGRAFGYQDLGGTQKGCTQFSMILWFSRKATACPKIIFERADPLFHCLSILGSPHWVGDPPPRFAAPAYHVFPGYENFARVWNTGHPTRNNCSMVLLLPWPNPIVSGQPMEALIDQMEEFGRNRMWVIAEQNAP